MSMHCIKYHLYVLLVRAPSYGDVQERNTLSEPWYTI